MFDSRQLAGELIRRARQEGGLSQAELARRAGMPRSVLNAYEHHHRQPGVDALARIAQAVGMEVRLEPPLDRVDPARAGRILVQVLDLAEALPNRQRGRLAYPSLKALGS
ncbi:MAG TPA: helix-turn-helix transcriptional regulator [Solirubrobacteraceae bacterium]|jgi:transcriptional regulator with XRE-family HTH domain